MSATLLLLAATAAAPPAPVNELKVPPGFTARLFADNPLAPDIYTMTVDDAGRLLVAGRGYVRVLVDADGDGCADRAVDLLDGLKDGPMGLLAEGDSLYVVADGGLKRYRGYNGRDKLKGPPETLVALKTTGEHDAHAVRRGPDGWLYLLCGNMAGVRKEIVTDRRSPVREPVAGALVRISPDGKSVEVVADGFRNPYSFDFNLDGEPFTYDSDNERCVGLPWYEPCRFYHVVPGGNYGWRSPQLGQFWRKPPYFPDVVPPVCYLGRGSPTGVACYRHTQFPEEYRGGFFLADWTFGRIHHVPLKAKDSTYSGEPEVFAQATGTSGFAPTALAVHPKTGELFASIGGRGTRGGVYRISYDKGDANPQPLPMAKRSLDHDKDAARRWLADCASDDARVRRNALEMLLRWREKVPWDAKLTDAVKPNLSHADPLVRALAGRASQLMAVPLGTLTDTQARLTLALEEAETEPAESLKTALAVLGDSKAPEALKLQAARVVQLALGDMTAKDAVGTVFEGYTFRKPASKETADRVLQTLKPQMNPYPSGGAPYRVPITNLERELARIAAGLGGGDEKVHWWISPWLGLCQARTYFTGQVRDDIHLLACFGRLTKWATRDEDGHIAGSLLNLEVKRAKEKLTTDRHWDLRINELGAALIPGHMFLDYRILRHADFGRLEHVRFVKHLKMKPDAAARRFLDAAERNPDSPWTPAVVELFPALPREEVAPVLDKLWERPHLAGPVIRVLAAAPRDADRPRFLVGLDSLDPEVVRVSAGALAKLTKPEGYAVYVAAIKALRRLPDERGLAAPRAAVVALLQVYSGEKIGADARAWAAWLAKRDADAARELDAADGFDAAKWRKRLAGIDWSKGDAERGRAAFAKASCAACHDGGRALGPPLAGVTKRFGRDDLLTSILQPSKDVSPRYRATRVTTTDEKSYTGIVVYEATDSVILQTGIDTAVRVAGAEVASKRQVEVSLMPAGLLDKLTDAEIADLLAYLGTLVELKPK